MVDTPDTLVIPPGAAEQGLILVSVCLYHGIHKLGVVRIIKRTGMQQFYSSAICIDDCGFRAAWRPAVDVPCKCDPLYYIKKKYGKPNREGHID